MGSATGISAEKRRENYKRQSKADFEKKDAADAEAYQNEPSYWGKEDATPEGRRAAAAAENAVKEANDAASKKAGRDVYPNDYPARGQKVEPRHKVATEAAQNVIRNKLPALDAETSGYKKGGKITSSASKRADGCAKRGKTRGKMI